MDRDVKSILIGVPSAREDERFLASLSSLIKQMKGKYQVGVIMEKWKHLPKIQNMMVDYMLANDYDYILFLDDDHSGHTVEMVDSLVAANTYMATMKTYIRYFPYPIGLFKRQMFVGQEKMIGHYQQGGYSTVDMTGFPMTLLRRDLFERIQRPFFEPMNDGARNWCTDVPFCLKLEKVGIKPVGCYDHCLDHDGITEANVSNLREKNAKKWIDRFRLEREVRPSTKPNPNGEAVTKE